MTLSRQQLLDRYPLTDDKRRWLVYCYWGLKPEQLAEPPTALEPWQLVLFTWLQQVGGSWLSELFHERVVDFCQPYLAALAQTTSPVTQIGVGVLDFRYAHCLGVEGFLDLQTGQVVDQLDVPACSYLWCDLPVLEKRIRCATPSLSPS